MSDITTAEAEDFIREARTMLQKATGEDYASVTLKIDGGGNIQWSTYVDNDTHRNAPSLAEALNEAAKHMNPEAKARELRTQAAELIARADKLTPNYAPE